MCTIKTLTCVTVVEVSIHLCACEHALHLIFAYDECLFGGLFIQATVKCVSLSHLHTDTGSCVAHTLFHFLFDERASLPPFLSVCVLNENHSNTLQHKGRIDYVINLCTQHLYCYLFVIHLGGFIVC